MTLKADLSNLLLKHFGFNRFRENQFEIIESLVTGNDTLVIMPTGGGKSPVSYTHLRAHETP